jgi:hypothetical protein
MLHALAPFAVGVVEIVVLWGVIALACGAVGLVRTWWWAWRERSRLAYERYAAEQFIREARRQGIREMLTAERTYRDRFGDGDVIEGTAIEVKVER